MTFKLPKFALDPPEWKEVQRLRRAGKVEQADALEAHYISGDHIPYVTHGYGCGTKFVTANGDSVAIDGAYVTINGEFVMVDDLKNHPRGHLVQWMLDNMLARLA